MVLRTGCQERLRGHDSVDSVQPLNLPCPNWFFGGPYPKPLFWGTYSCILEIQSAVPISRKTRQRLISTRPNLRNFGL